MEALDRGKQDEGQVMGASKLNINLHALRSNYQYLDRCSLPTCRTGAAVKANAYGLGMVPVSDALYESGCRHFFVAQATEAVTLRQAMGNKRCQIFVLEGPHADELSDYQAYKITPVLNTTEQIEHLIAFNMTNPSPLPSALHIDTAMSRLGLATDELHGLSDHLLSDTNLPLCLVMSHLACADDPSHILNANQLQVFSSITGGFGNIPKSLANSAGIFLAEEFHFDLTRPGISLYGVMSDPEMINEHLKPVLNWQADILQIRNIDKGQCVGYGADFIAKNKMKLATIGVGYADGYARELFQQGQKKTALVGISGYAVPLVGRVSMD